MSTIGVKHDGAKLRWTLLPLDALEDVVRVLEYGAQKYDADNWRYVKPRWRYLDAALRHVLSRVGGEILDPESQLPHTSHAICCLLFLGSFDKAKPVERAYAPSSQRFTGILDVDTTPG